MNTELKTMYIFKSEIYSNDLGDGWNDNHATAKALANYTEMIWRFESSAFKDDFEIGFGIKQKEYGYLVEMFINTDDLDIVDEITASLSDDSAIWDRFCNDIKTLKLWEDRWQKEK
jgi:hypothetical protein